MPYRTVKTYSDRGSIKDVSNQEEYQAPTDEELHLKKLYEYAEATRDQQLKDSLGFIVMSNAGDRSAFPISIYRHREYINSLSEERRAQIELVKQELAGCFSSGPTFHKEARMAFFKQQASTHAILENGELIIKVASANVVANMKRAFRRVR